MVFGPFGLKTSIHFACSRNIQIRNAFEEIFCLPSNLKNESIISALRPGLKTGIDFGGLV